MLLNSLPGARCPGRRLPAAQDPLSAILLLAVTLSRISTRFCHKIHAIEQVNQAVTGKVGTTINRTLCSLEDGCQSSGATCCLQLQGAATRWRQYVPPKRPHTPTSLYCVLTQHETYLYVIFQCNYQNILCAFPQALHYSTLSLPEST
jgi:hypothetical protein